MAQLADGLEDVEHFVRSQTEEGYMAEIREAGFVASVVIGRDTPAISNDNDQIHALVSRHSELVGVGSVDPERLGRHAVDEAERAIRRLELKAINLEPGFANRSTIRCFGRSMKPCRIGRRRFF